MQSQASVRESHSEKLIEFAVSLSRANVPARVFKQAQVCFLDSIACGLFGAKQPWGEMMAANTLAESAPGPCTLLGRPETIAPAPAALVNGTAIHGFELDDLIVGAVVHPGAIVVPAALDAHGTPADPCSDAERSERFRKLASAAVPSAVADRILEAASRLDELSSVRAFSQALSG
jgi:hypothetical protein